MMIFAHLPRFHGGYISVRIEKISAVESNGHHCALWVDGISHYISLGCNRTEALKIIEAAK